MCARLHDPDWPAGLRPEPAALQAAGSGVGGRRYGRLAAAGPWGDSLFVKVFPPGGRRDAEREFRAGRRLRTAGGPTPRPWAVLPAPPDWWLLLEDLGPRAALAPEAVRSDPALQEAVGRAAAALHATGAVHGDLHLGNLLRAPDGRLLWVDLRRLRRPRRRLDAARLEDLGRLLASLEPFPARALLRLTGAWLAGLEPGAPPARRKALARQVAAAGDRRLRLHHGNLDRRARREALAGALTRGGHPALWREALAPWQEELEAIAARGEACKDGDRSRVARGRLPDGRTVVVKHYRPRRPADPRDRLGLGKALVSLLAAEGLRRRGFRAARPMAAWSRPGAGSWLVLEDLAHLPPLHEAVAASGGGNAGPSSGSWPPPSGACTAWASPTGI